MNRTIKFRGKRIDTGEWVYGYYVVDPLQRHRIYFKPFDESTNNTYHFVIPETVGQFTGLLDKNGKEIYEGDIISIDKKASLHQNCPITVIGSVHFRGGKYEVITRNVINRMFLNKGSIHFGVSIMEWISLPEFIRAEVIGNIHDNPELLNK